MPARQRGRTQGGDMDTDSFSDLDDEGSGLELVHVSDVLDYLGEYTLSQAQIAQVIK